MYVPLQRVLELSHACYGIVLPLLMNMTANMLDRTHTSTFPTVCNVCIGIPSGYLRTEASTWAINLSSHPAQV